MWIFGQIIYSGIIILAVMVLLAIGLIALLITQGQFIMQHIKKIYLYLVSLVALVIMVIGTIMLINLALRTWVFPKADQADYYYPPKIACDLPTPAPGEPSYTLPAECADPNYEEKMKAEEQERRSAQKQRDAAQAVAMIIVSAPIFYYHWRLARKEA